MNDVKFIQNEPDEPLRLLLDTGGIITLDVENENVHFFDGGGCEFHSDNAKDIHFKIGGLHWPLHTIIARAVSQYDAINAETIEAHNDELAMAEELSSPYLTGRI